MTKSQLYPFLSLDSSISTTWDDKENMNNPVLFTTAIWNLGSDSSHEVPIALQTCV